MVLRRVRFSTPIGGLRSRGFDEGDFGVGQAVELIDELIDLAVGGLDLPLNHRLGMPGLGLLRVGVEGEHLLDQHDNPV